MSCFYWRYAKIVGLPARTASEPTMYGGYEGSVFGGIIEVGEILVLMEDALREKEIRKRNVTVISLNPCSNGICSQR